MNEITKELLDACRQAAEQIRRCDYTPARSTLLTVIKKAEAAMPEPQHDTDGWIEWSGGECPTHPSVNIEAELRSGEVIFEKAGRIGWRHAKAFDPQWKLSQDIIAYRIVK